MKGKRGLNAFFFLILAKKQKTIVNSIIKIVNNIFVKTRNLWRKLPIFV